MIDQSYDLDYITNRIKTLAKSSQNEEDLKLVIGPEFDNIAEHMGLERAQYERMAGSRTILSRGRTDALYGRFILEYKSLGLLSKTINRNSAIQQVKNYIEAKSTSEGLDKSLYFSAIIDGINVLFIQYSSIESKWRVKGPFEINRGSVNTILEAIRGLKRKALDGNEIIRDLGPSSVVAKEFIRALYQTELTSDRSKVIFDEWYRTFLQVVSYKSDRLRELNDIYEIKADNESEGKKLLFCVQTYFALIMKLIAAEVVQLYSGGRFMSSFLGELDDSRLKGNLVSKLKFFEEEGGFFQQITGIQNFLEGNFFSWYIDEWNDKIEPALFQIVETLSNYEPSTVDLQPERIKDLFKVLYQNLLPRKLRHAFGEYYTPDWLASLILDEIGINNDKDLLDKRVLDPACGSGTFLVNVIRRIRLLREDHNIDTRETFHKIISNVVGYDLNPLAVLATRANYVIALGELLTGHSDNFEIPVYLCDSVALRITNLIDQPVKVYELSTVVGTFRIPSPLAQGPFLGKVLSLMKSSLSIENSEETFREVLKTKIQQDSDFVDIMGDQYKMLLSLKNKDGIWLGILRNTFAPLLKGKFDYVVGNPPWVNWESLPQNYREISRPVWQEYGLLDLDKNGFGARMGTIKRDVSMLFITVSAKKYLNEQGILGMLCPYTLFKVTAGRGFRKYIKGLSIKKILDLVEMRPFEGATTRTSAIILKLTPRTVFPIPCEMWRPNNQIRESMTLEEVKSNSSVFALQWFPSSRIRIDEPWVMLTERAYLGLRKAIGQSAYDAHAGVFTGLNGAYWIEVLKDNGKEAYIRNLNDVGKTKIPMVEGWIESDLIFPLIRGRDISEWIGGASGNILLPVYRNGDTISEEKMRIDFPKTYAFLSKLKKNLLKRGALPYKAWFANDKNKIPFYALFNANVGFGKYKIAWQYISGRVSGKAKFVVGLIPYDEQKPIIPNEKLMIITTNLYEESLFILGVLNSSISKLIVASYSIETHIAPDIMNRIKIPAFNSEDKSHLDIVELVGKIRSLLIAKEEKDEINQFRYRLDQLVASLYSITDYELNEIKEDLAILMGSRDDNEDTEDEESE